MTAVLLLMLHLKRYLILTTYEQELLKLQQHPKTWLITGAAGFIGSNLLETLLKNDQTVVGLDNFSTGHQRNLDEVESLVSKTQWARFKLLRGDICDLSACASACENVNYVLHQAALGSVPRSINDPIKTNNTNITGFLNMLVAARDAKVDSFTYAASSSTYGDHPALPKVEDVIGNPLSPYAVTKYVNELYAQVFAKTYDFNTIGLRYFNIFGKRQDPEGAYAAVIPKWTASMIAGDTVTINGDGETSRDFCFVENAVQANILAATSKNEARNQIYNVALNHRTSLNQLFDLIRNCLSTHGINYLKQPNYKDFRSGDVRHSQANIDKAVNQLGYSPKYSINKGIEKAMPWYINL